MGHGSITLLPGVDTNRTPAMNEAQVVNCDLIRFMPDPKDGCLVQKLGGWVKFFPDPISSPIRALLPWQDTNNQGRLAVGAEQELSIISNGVKSDITPKQLVSNSSPNFTTQTGNPTVEVIDSNGTVVTEFDAVYLVTPVSVGGAILQGFYATSPTRDVPYFINNHDIFDQSSPVPQTIMNGGVVPSFSTIQDSSIVTVDFPNHGLTSGDITSFLAPTPVGGITIYGNYIVNTVSSPDIYTIIANNAATSTQSNYGMNADPLTPTIGRVQFIYSLTDAPVPALGFYGYGIYGNGIYGIGTVLPPSTGTPITATDWSLDNFGSFLIASPVNDTPIDIYHQTGGPIYYWNPITPQIGPQILVNAPAFCEVVFVAMPQRQVFALACEPQGIQEGSILDVIQDPLLIRWSDINDPTSWAPQITNQAGSLRIPTGSKIVGGIQGPHQVLIWTDIALWALQYQNLPDVYTPTEIAKGCGLIGRRAMVVMDGIVYWMTQTRFMRLGGDGVMPLICPIWDVIFQEIDMQYVNNIRMGGNSRFSEIIVFFPTIGSGGRITKYVKYNTTLNQWDFGTMPRTAWINESIFGPPIAGFESSPTINYIYQHEKTNDADGQAMISFFDTGYAAISEGDQQIFVDQVWPDMKWGYYGGAQDAKINMKLLFTDYPGKAPRVTPNFLLTQKTTFVSPRARGRLMAISIGSSDLGSFWRIGKLRYRSQPDGVF